MDKFNIIKKAISTEKSTVAKSKNNEYFFEVDRRAKKPEIAKAVQEIFNVSVESVRTSINKPVLKIKRGKKSYTSIVKKAGVRLKKGDSI